MDCEIYLKEKATLVPSEKGRSNTIKLQRGERTGSVTEQLRIVTRFVDKEAKFTVRLRVHKIDMHCAGCARALARNLNFNAKYYE